MKNRFLIIGILVVLMMITSSFSISAQKIKTTNESAVNTSLDCILDNSSYVAIEGEITGKIFNIHAYYIVDGVDNDFHRESWECTITEESGINFEVPKPQDEQDHYQITGQLEGYKSNTVDFYITPEDDWAWVRVKLTPSINSKSTNPTILKFLDMFPILCQLLKLLH